MNDSVNPEITFYGNTLCPVTAHQRKHVEQALKEIGYTADWMGFGGITPYSDTSNASGPPQFWNFIADDDNQVSAIKAWLQENPYQSATP